MPDGDSMNTPIKYFITGVIASLFIASTSYAFDMDEALVIYQEELGQQQQYQEVPQRQYTRE